VFVGPVRTSVSTLAALPNVRFVSAQPQAALPSLFKGFSVGLVPYALGPMVRFIYPTKLNDYAGAGLPVVATMLPELEGISSDILACIRGADEFIAAVERLAPTRWMPDLVRSRLAFAAENSWARRASAIADGVDAVLEGRS